MKSLRTKSRADELRDARELGVVLALALKGSQAEMATQLAAMRTEIEGLRAELVERDRRVVRDALEVVRDSGIQVGTARQQAAFLADSDQMLEVAGDLAAAGALQHLASLERTPDAILS